MSRCAAPVAIALALAALSCSAAVSVPAAAGEPEADPRERFTALEENDSLYFNSDKHYTQGLRLAYLAPDLDGTSGWQAPFEFLGGIAPLFQPADGSGKIFRRYSVFLGQSIFTPKDKSLNPPDPRDRPYAGWLYGGVSLLQETPRADNSSMLEDLELQIGVVGPWALGKQVQNDWHQFFSFAKAQGWHAQLKNEPGLTLSYERMWRFPLAGDGDAGLDVVPGLGATVGNVFTYGNAGVMLRAGTGLGSDFGPAHIRPALSGSDYFAADRAGDGFGYYFYVGAQGRVVGRNVFLDGNSFHASPSVDKKIFVGDLAAGFALFWSSAMRVDFSVVQRSEEFKGQHGPDEIGTASIAVTW